MQNVLSFLATLFIAPTLALVAESPLVTKRSGGGFAPREYVRFESCEVYLDRVVISRQLGFDAAGFEVKEERKISLSEGIQVALKQARTEKLEEKPNNLCDAPTTSIYLGSDENALILFTSGACGSPRKERKGTASQKLRELVGFYCVKTFDHIGE
jgi:hypothetical protein